MQYRKEAPGRRLARLCAGAALAALVTVRAAPALAMPADAGPIVVSGWHLSFAHHHRFGARRHALGTPEVPGIDVGNPDDGADDGDDGGDDGDDGGGGAPDDGGDDGGSDGGTSAGGTGNGGSDRQGPSTLGQPGHVNRFAMSLGRDLGPFSAIGAITAVAEDKTVLGARFAPSYGVRGADSVMLDGAVDWTTPLGLMVGGAWRQDFTQVRGGGLAAGGDRLRSTGWALAATRYSTLQHGDTVSLRLAKPLAIPGTPVDGNLPMAWTSAGSGWLGEGGPLLPKGRETVGELAWHGYLVGGEAAASVFWRRDPGNRADLPSDRGFGLSWSRRL